ncbi:MAG: menaquinone-dependent protoporphyrinogen IX dehydrogenase [Solirubrobacteraceae bacterium]
MTDVLIVYASNHGHTGKIAARIAAALEADGVRPDVREVSAAAEVSPSDYDAVVVGASIHGGHHQKEMIDWCSRHRTTLGVLPTAFFSVCLTAADDTDESREATRRYIDEFVESTGWTPQRTTTFAGALQYREYDFATRLVMRLLMHRGHHETDTRRDWDYTDWDAVEAFGHALSAMPTGTGAR